MMMQFLQETLAGDTCSLLSGETATLRWQRCAPGVIELTPHGEVEQSVVISAGIHGNETAPVEIVAQLVQDLLHGQRPLAVRLLIIFGNLPALRSGERYLDVDMNRLFSGKHQHYPACDETRRAALIEQWVGDFYLAAPDTRRVHFDLHTARKPSLHVRFGLLPYVDCGRYPSAIIEWLRRVGLEALVINHAPAATFSYFSSHQYGADSCTLELGKALPFGENLLHQFTGIEQGLQALVSGETTPDHSAPEMPVYQVSQELTKLSQAFRLNFAESVENFTAFKHGELLAHDGDTEYRVRQDQEWLIFPNSGVRPGLRAGLMLTRTTLDQWLD